jgi:hypothetical protein
MIAYGMNMWKFAKASATADGCGDVRTQDGGSDDPPVVKLEPGCPPPEDDGTAAMALSPLMRPKGEGDDGAVKKGPRARGSQKMQAVRPDGDPGDDASRASQDRRPRRRRRRRTTRSLGRPSSTP